MYKYKLMGFWYVLNSSFFVCGFMDMFKSIKFSEVFGPSTVQVRDVVEFISLKSVSKFVGEFVVGLHTPIMPSINLPR